MDCITRCLLLLSVLAQIVPRERARSINILCKSLVAFLTAFFGYRSSVAIGMVMPTKQVSKGFGQSVPQRGLKSAP
jgi:hypothetical protein